MHVTPPPILRSAALLLLAMAAPGLAAQQATPERANWAQAEKFSAANLRKFTYSTSLTPNWLGKSDRFWYSWRSSAGTRYWLVDCEHRNRRPLFDHETLATALSVASKKAQHAAQLELGGARVDDAGGKLTFTFEGRRYEYDLATGGLGDKGAATRQAPDTGRSGSGAGDGNRNRDSERRREEQDQDREQQQQQQQQQQQREGQEQQERQEQRQQDGQQSEQSGRSGEGVASSGGEPPRRSGAPRERDVRLVSPDGKVYVVARDHDLYVVEGVEAPAEASVPAADKPEGQQKAEKEDSGKQEVVKVAKATDKKENASATVAGAAAAPAAPTATPPAPKAPPVRFDEASAVRLSSDSAERYSFAGSRGSGGSSGGGRANQRQTAEATAGDVHKAESVMAPAPARANATWSKDSKAFYASRRDSRNVQDLFLVDSLGTPRPTLETYPYAMPGEGTASVAELWVFAREQKQLRQVARKWPHESYQDVHFFGEGHELRYVRRDRLQRNAELCALDPATGKERVLLTEAIGGATLAIQSLRYLAKTNQFLWWSERSGWGHYWLHDAATGASLGALTNGAFRARSIVEVDEETGHAWVRANGRERDENIYHEHLYRVRLNGMDMLCLDPGDATHRSTLSPTRRFVVDTFSRVDLAPRAVLRSGNDGSVLLELETTDTSKLEEAGWRMPERFIVKAADGVTDLYGNLWKPYDFDAKKRYPVIANVYPGPQMEGVTHSFSVSGGGQHLAQLGFIVVQVGHRGGTPDRDKAYGAYGFGNLRDYGLEDKKTALEQLGDRYSFIDLTRVGIYGHSGGGFMTAAALMKPPYNRFFKVGVASAGNHDNNIYSAQWSERWHGLGEAPPTKVETKAETKTDATKAEAATGGVATAAEGGKEAKQAAAAKASPFTVHVPTNAELAANLEGKLLLVHGEIDNNVHPANTMRLVDALIRANKRFDMLLIPGARHSFGAAQEYFRQRMLEYFAEHLLGDRQTGADITRKNG